MFRDHGRIDGDAPRRRVLVMGDRIPPAFPIILTWGVALPAHFAARKGTDQTRKTLPAW